MAQYKTVGNLKVRTDLSPEKQALVNQIAKNYVNEQKAINKSYLKDMARMVGGTALSGASFLPVLNIPGAGAAVGGAMYDLGQGIVEGDKARDLVKRAARGAAIGAVIPPAAKKIAATKAGQAVGKQLTKVAEKVAQNPTVQKAYDALMTDIRAFNPNKQTVYHGSPYDFNKFSNEAIGTGEGAQAHGMGHYAALDKNIADNRYRKRQLRTVEEREVDSKYKPLFDKEQKIFDSKSRELYNLRFKDNKLSEEEYQKGIDEASKKTYEILDEWHNAINNIDKTKATKETGQLYKLSVPKDDVMLREGALMSNQPNMSNLWDEIRLDRVNKSTTSLPKFKMALGANDIDINKTFNTKYFNDALEMVKNNPEQYKDLFLKDMTGRELYGYLESVLGSRKAATEYLQQRGIKGISYNGGIDGESRVIFNPDDIVIGRKYYNQPTLKDIYNKFINSGAIADAITNP